MTARWVVVRGDTLAATRWYLGVVSGTGQNAATRVWTSHAFAAEAGVWPSRRAAEDAMQIAQRTRGCESSYPAWSVRPVRRRP